MKRRNALAVILNTVLPDVGYLCVSGRVAFELILFIGSIIRIFTILDDIRLSRLADTQNPMYKTSEKRWEFNT